jgi:arylsulfatase A-like enzyme
MKLLVLTARGVRATALGPYGNSWTDTPALDALAARGIVFDRHLADRPDPEGARRAWRTGCYDLPRSPGESVAPAVPAPDLLEVLRGRGVRTWLLVDASRPAPPFFEEGWEVVERVDAASEATALEAVLERASQVLGQLAGQDDWLLWIDLATPLPPWDVPEEFLQAYFSEEPLEGEEEGEADEEEEEEVEEEEGSEEDEEVEPLEPIEGEPPVRVDPEDDEMFLRLHTTYAAALSYLDTGLESLLEELAGLPGCSDVGVLFTSDHGLPLGEHEDVGLRSVWPFAERVHLPLLVRLPGDEGAGRHVSAWTQAIDLAVTVARWFGADLPGCQGIDLLPLARGTAEVPARPYACSGVERDGQAGWALWTAERKLLVATRPGEDTVTTGRLYVQPDDAWEVNDIAGQELEQAEQLQRTLFAFLAASRRPGPLTWPPLE